MMLGLLESCMTINMFLNQQAKILFVKVQLKLLLVMVQLELVLLRTLL